MKNFIKVIGIPLYLLLVFQGCALKEKFFPKHSAPTMQEKPTNNQTITPSSPLESKEITTPQAQAVFTNAKVMKFPTTRGKTITIKADANLLKVTNKAYQNKEVLLYLFGRDCPHCVKETKQIKALARKSNLKIIGIHAQKMIGNPALKAYIKKIGYHFDVLSFKNDITLIRYLKKSGIWYGGTPTHLLIDRQGNVTEMTLSEIRARR